MKTIYIRGGDAKEPGVNVLKAHLEAKGHHVVRNKKEDYDVVVCWGCSMRDPQVRDVPVLNGQVNLFNKYEALMRFQDAGIPIPMTVKAADVVGRFPHAPEKGPWFGRQLAHEKGKDIVVYDTWRKVLANNNSAFYTLYFKHAAELRAWVYKDRVFAWYKKYYRNPGLENYKNLEYRSELLPDFRNLDMENAAILSVKALRMDFGAVDMLQRGDEFMVLEVNSMPDISSTERVSGIRLANIIHNWAEAR
jgi:hypothetical protein